MPSTMRSILVVVVITVLAITAVESLNCIQCHSLEGSCFNSNVTACPEDAFSCFSSSVNSSLGGTSVLYQNMGCSKQNCSETNTLVAFAVHVTEEHRFHFASQCCQGEKCNDTSHDFEGAQMLSNTQCPACYGNDTAFCNNNQTQQCYNEEQCIHLIAEFINGTESKNLTLKGCSKISNSTCEFLSTGNQTVGNVIFHEVKCSNAFIIPTSQPNNTSSQPSPTSAQPNNISSQSSTTSTQPTTTSNAGMKVPLTSLALGSLLFLGLLF